MAINPNNITTIQVVQLDTVPFTLDSVIPHQPANELKQGTVQSLIDLIATALDTGTGVGFFPISVTNGQQLPDLPETPSFFLCGAGTYLNVNGFPDIICTAELNAIMSLTDHWALAVEIPITAPVGVQSVTGSAVDNTDPQNPVIDVNTPPLQTVVEQGNRYTGATGWTEFDANGSLSLSRNDEEFTAALNTVRGLEISTTDLDENGNEVGIINVGTNLDDSGFTGIRRNDAYYNLGNRPAGYYNLLVKEDLPKQIEGIPFQDGDSNILSLGAGPTINGVSYQITDNTGLDVINCGAPNNNVGTWFIANGNTPTSWGSGTLQYDEGAPVLKILSNTLGNTWFTVAGGGEYYWNSEDLFVNDKTIVPYAYYSAANGYEVSFERINSSQILIRTRDSGVLAKGILTEISNYFSILLKVYL